MLRITSLSVRVVLCGLMASAGGFASQVHAEDCYTADDFEDGAINASLWLSGGQNRDNNGLGGPWEWSVDELTDPNDGYLSMHVWGPGTGLTTSGEAWTRTVRDYNDGLNHIIRFTWEGASDPNDPHFNLHHIQITDGWVSPDGYTHWTWVVPISGTTDLLWGDNGHPGKFYPDGKPRNEWSISIDPAGFASLYDENGALIRTEPLDAAYPWHVRFLVLDATSSGFPGGDTRFNLYDFASAPSPESCYADDLDDGGVDSCVWDRGGQNRDNGGIGGPWEWSVDELIDPNDGYLSMHVWGPGTGLTTSGEAWTRTNYNYNDGLSHVIRFMWDMTVVESHYNYAYIQVTDGFIDPSGNTHWPDLLPPGTTNLLWRTPDSTAPGLGFPAGKPKNEWRIEIDPAGVAKLYDENGDVVREEPLDASYAWYVRFMVIDATSSGFPGGDTRLNLYDFKSASECCDCNANGIPDDEDIASGYTQDANGNGIPDECDIPGDLDGDGDVDLADLALLLAHYGERVYACP